LPSILDDLSVVDDRRGSCRSHIRWDTPGSAGRAPNGHDCLRTGGIISHFADERARGGLDNAERVLVEFPIYLNLGGLLVPFDILKHHAILTDRSLEIIAIGEYRDFNPVFTHPRFGCIMHPTAH